MLRGAGAGEGWVAWGWAEPGEGAASSLAAEGGEARVAKAWGERGGVVVEVMERARVVGAMAKEAGERAMAVGGPGCCTCGSRNHRT